MHLNSNMSGIVDADAAFCRLLPDNNLRCDGHKVAAESLRDERERTRHSQVALDHFQLVVLSQNSSRNNGF